MNKIAQTVTVTLFLVATTLPIHAGSIHGCTDSPENPTAVLGLMVSAASFGLLHIRNRIAMRKKTDNK